MAIKAHQPFIIAGKPHVFSPTNFFPGGSAEQKIYTDGRVFIIKPSDRVDISELGRGNPAKFRGRKLQFSRFTNKIGHVGGEVEIIAPTARSASPLSIILRDSMKRQLISHLQLQLERSSSDEVLEGLPLLVAGSSYFLFPHSNVFPFPHRKSEDLDLKIDVPENASAEWKREAFGKYDSFLHGALKFIGCEVEQKREYSSDTQDGYVMTIYRDFSRGEISRIIEERRLAFETEIPECLRVHLTVDFLGTKPVANLLPLVDAPYIATRSIKLVDPRQYLAKNLARSLKHANFADTDDPNGYKSVNLFNMYKILNARPELLETEGLSNDSDFVLIRLMTIVFLTLNGRSLADIRRDTFAPTRENVRLYLDALNPNLRSDRPLTEEDAFEVLATVDRFFRTVFPEVTHEPAPVVKIPNWARLPASQPVPRPTPGSKSLVGRIRELFSSWFGSTSADEKSSAIVEVPAPEYYYSPGGSSLQLTPQERAFFELCQGYLTDERNVSVYPPPHATVEIGLLDGKYAELWRKHPGLRERIADLAGLNDRVREINERRP